MIGVRFKFEAKQFDALIEKTLSPDARRRKMASIANTLLEESLATNERLLGTRPSYRQFVDQREGAAFEDVSPGGVIFVKFDLATQVARGIVSLLRTVSPYDPTPDGKPHYRDRHFVIVDGLIQDPPYDDIASFERMLIINDLVYSNFLEAKYAIYEALAFPYLKRLFGNGFQMDLVRDDYFGYRNLGILVRPR